MCSQNVAIPPGLQLAFLLLLSHLFGVVQPKASDLTGDLKHGVLIWKEMIMGIYPGAEPAYLAQARVAAPNQQI